jgi:hypothetical protein
LGYDSVKAIEIIERSQEVNQVKKWLELIEPVHFVDVSNQNLEKQITVISTISMYCRNQTGGGVYPYQTQVSDHIFEKEENIPLRFTT